MPTYDYRCTTCNHEFSAFQRITEDALDECPACGALTLQRLIGTGAGIIFKGSGFYETDYKRSRSGGEKKDSGGEPKKDGGGEGGDKKKSGSKGGDSD